MRSFEELKDGYPPSNPHWIGEPDTVQLPEEKNPFATLLGKEKWTRLRPAIRNRFSRKLNAADSITYQGVTVKTEMSPLGWLLAQLGRIAGAPLPLDQDNGGTAAVVTVTEMEETASGGGGQFWTRVYGRKDKFPQIIRSVKQFSGPTGLQEKVCGGLTMSLTLQMEADKLIFKSQDYFLTLGHLKLKLPEFLTPGTLTITHEDLGAGWFSFTLHLTHKLAGALLYQKAVFSDPASFSQQERLNG